MVAKEIANGVEFRVILSIEGQHNQTTIFTTRKAAKAAIKEMERDLEATNTGYVIRLICNVIENGELVCGSEIGRSKFDPSQVITVVNAPAAESVELSHEETAPEFSKLSHAATNIVLTAENDGDIYRKRVAPLIQSLTNKIKRGITPDRKRLVKSSAMRDIITIAVAELYRSGWTEDNGRVTMMERKEAANYLAWSYISDAEDEYNNQMVARK